MEGDRRYFANSAKEEKRAGKAFCDWWKKGGDAHTTHYLMHYDLSGFDPFAAALETEF